MAKTTLLIAFFVLMTALVPQNARSVQTIDSVTFQDLEKLKGQRLSQAEYQAQMRVLRYVMREKLLGHIWRKAHADPGFRMGALKFRELFEKLETFNIFQNDTRLALKADPERRSDFYVLNGGWGAINRNAFEESNLRGRLVLPLHVFLGAVGYQDENYQLSLLLVLFNQTLAPGAATSADGNLLARIDWARLFPPTAEELYRITPQEINPQPAPQGNEASAQTEEKLLAAGGGFTGVGGGGDVLSLIVKMELIDGLFAINPNMPLSEFCYRRWTDPTQYLDDILKSEIESDPRVQLIEFEAPPKHKGRILIPRFSAENKKKLRETGNLARICLCALQEKRK